MNKQYTNGELGIMIQNLCSKVEDGFNGVHERQDKTNGNVIRNTEYRLKASGSLSALKYIVGLLSAVNVLTIIKMFI